MNGQMDNSDCMDKMEGWKGGWMDQVDWVSGMDGWMNKEMNAWVRWVYKDRCIDQLLKWMDMAEYVFSKYILYKNGLLLFASVCRLASRRCLLRFCPLTRWQRSSSCSWQGNVWPWWEMV